MSSNLNAPTTNTGKFSGGESKIESAIEIEHISELKIYYGIYFIGLIILLSIYLGPFFYFKIIRGKNFSSHNNIGIKHAI